MGSGNGMTDLFGPRYFMDRDVVLVTINYRLGPFGKKKSSLFPCKLNKYDFSKRFFEH